jgi:hypothetical protein
MWHISTDRLSEYTLDMMVHVALIFIRFLHKNSSYSLTSSMKIHYAHYTKQ